MPGEIKEIIEQDAPRPTLSALFARLIEEGGAFLRANLLLYRAQATKKAFSAGIIVALVGGAIMLVQAVIVALLVGLIIILAPIVGACWSVFIVVSVTLCAIAACVLIARVKISALLKPQEPS
jgi:hypothetical protein